MEGKGREHVGAESSSWRQFPASHNPPRHEVNAGSTEPKFDLDNLYMCLTAKDPPEDVPKGTGIVLAFDMNR